MSKLVLLKRSALAPKSGAEFAAIESTNNRRALAYLRDLVLEWSDYPLPSWLQEEMRQAANATRPMRIKGK